MSVPAAAFYRLAGIPGLSLRRDASLREYTRFALGGPADVLALSDTAEALESALQLMRAEAVPHVIIGGGSNLIVSDSGFPGCVLRYQPSSILHNGSSLLVDSGAVLQDVVDFAVVNGLAGLETMTGIPGWLGGAVYGNAGAYGHSIQEVVRCVVATDGAQTVRFNTAECQFAYRESYFKSHKEWVILSAELGLRAGDAAELKKIADDIREVRDRKYPPSMKCAGSIFKNLLFDRLPATVRAQVPPTLVREGKVPSAWFLEQVDAKGMRLGDIQVAEYHANLIYNDGAGTAADLRSVIAELKRRVSARFGFNLEEEVQFVG